MGRAVEPLPFLLAFLSQYSILMRSCNPAFYRQTASELPPWVVWVFPLGDFS